MSEAAASPLPASTGLPASGLSHRRQRLVAWWRQTCGVFRAARRSRLRPALLAGRLSWLLAAQGVLAGVAAWALVEAGLDGVPPEAGAAVGGVALLLLSIHALGRLASVNSDVLRDVDEQVLDAYEASPLASSAYLAGRTLFHLLEQGLGFAALLPAFGLAHALRGIEWRHLGALVVALLAVSLAYCLGSIGRVLRAHSRRFRGATLPPGLRPNGGLIVAQALLGGAFAVATYAWYGQGAEVAAPLLLALSLTPAVPLAFVAGQSVEFFGRLLPVWLAASTWLLLVVPLTWSAANLRWKAPVRSAGRGLRAGFVLAWLAPALVLSGTVRREHDLALGAFLLVAALGAVVPAAWAGGGELAAVGERPGAPVRGLLDQRRSTAGAWALVLQAATLLLLALLAPAGLPREGWLLLAVVAFLGTLPTVLVAAAAARCAGPSRGVVLGFVLLSLVFAVVVPSLPRALGALESLPLAGEVARFAAGPVALLTASSPLAVLCEAGAALGAARGLPDIADVPAPWNLGLPDWACGALVQALLGLPLAWWLNRWARRRGR